MTKRTRRKFSAQEKVAILKLHLAEGQSVSDICDARGLNPTQFYRWHYPRRLEADPIGAIVEPCAGRDH
jgi:transposase-like protein